VWSVDLSTGSRAEDSPPAQRGHPLQQLAQADQAELRIAPRLLAWTRPIGVGPAPRELHRRAIRKRHHDTGLAARQDPESLTTKGMVATDNGDLGWNN
jgi:hypothetical protein